MEFEIRLFATLKDRVGKERIRVHLTPPVDVEKLLTAVATDYPALAPALPTILASVNKEFASKATPITPSDEIALFPPVSGGSDHPTYFAITEDEIDINAIHDQLRQPDVGAIVSFTGSVRGQTERDGLPPETLYLEYEAYNEMAVQKMAQIAREIWAQWPLVKGVAIVQRIGKLNIGDTTTFIACASGHRDQGVFDAARYGIDRLKEIVPVWKKEVSPDKSEWVAGHYIPTEEDN